MWRVKASDGRSGAIKLLYPPHGKGDGRYRLGRFRDEIGFLIAHPDFPGILPLLDSRISDDLSETSWYVMPEARRIRVALGSDPEPGVVVAAVAEIATTLAVLADEGVAHRDIKPDNLFELGGRWLVGDFGLVTYPDKDPRTEHGRRLGPIDYMAPEMRRDADKAKPGPADVWALAKTLWVLLTGEALPVPGTHRATEAAHSLRERITYGFSAELDRMLEKATLIAPEQRISMADMVTELRACTALPAEMQESANVDELRSRIEVLTAAARQQASEKQALHAEFRLASHEMCKLASDAAAELGRLLSFDIHPATGDGYNSALMLPKRDFPFDQTGTEPTLISPPGVAQVQVIFSVTANMLKEVGPVDIAALLKIIRIDNGSVYEVDKLFARTYLDIPIGSAQQTNIIADIRNGFFGNFSSVLRQVIHVISEPPSGDLSTRVDVLVDGVGYGLVCAALAPHREPVFPASRPCQRSVVGAAAQRLLRPPALDLVHRRPGKLRPRRHLPAWGKLCSAAAPVLDADDAREALAPVQDLIAYGSEVGRRPHRKPAPCRTSHADPGRRSRA